MRIISRATLRSFWEQSIYSDSEQPLKSWFDEAKDANWNNSHEIKEKYGNASSVGNNRIVFNIHGNKYRLVIAIKYTSRIIFIRFVGTHKQYDKIDAKTI